MTSSNDEPTCFIARPMSITPEKANSYGGDQHHWDHVEEYLLAPAIQGAGQKSVSPRALGAGLIHEHVIEQVNDADYVLADFSGLNANVLFEAGVRTAANRPLIVVAEIGTTFHSTPVA